MGGGYSANFKNCATCAYWTGARSLNGTRTQVLYEYGTTGDCYSGSTTAPRFRKKAAGASCSSYEKWAQLKSVSSSSSSSSSSHSSSSSSSKKGTIPYPIFVAMIVIAGIIQYAAAHITYVISIGIIAAICIITCLIIRKRTNNPRRNIIITILASVVICIGTIAIISNKENNTSDIGITQELIDNTTIFEGYKPFLGSFNKIDHNNFYWGKLVVFGKIKSHWSGTIIETERATEKDKYKAQLSVFENEKSKSIVNDHSDINCIFFLSFDQNNRGFYIIDDFILYSNINGVTNAQKYNVKHIDNWIMNNIDK